MPTTRPRHQITETPDVARDLDIAARRWPHESRGQLLVRLAHLGREALEGVEAEARKARLSAVDATSGKYGDAFPEGYLADLREDWPE